MITAIKILFWSIGGLGVVLFPVEFFGIVIVVLFFGFLFLTIAMTML